MALALVAACGSSSDDVVGPFTGDLRRYFVDRITVPGDTSTADAFAADLDGDDKPDNKFGYATAVLAGTNDLTPHASDMIGAGALGSIVEIHADDVTNDDRAGLYYLGFGGTYMFSPLVAAVGGRFVDGAFIPNRTRATQHPGLAHVALPVFVNADPVGVQVSGLEIELASDGAGGFDGVVRGGIPERHAREQALAGLLQMFRTEPQRHLVFLRGVDEDRDDDISLAELEASVIGLLVSADIALGGEPHVSIAFGIHLTRCESATTPCPRPPPMNTCRDRIVDAGETDIDCGGPCQPCADGLACAAPADCQSNACDAGRCRLSTCTDGVRDGFESDVDCGGACPACATGDACAADRDCASNACDMGVATLGVCL